MPGVSPQLRALTRGRGVVAGSSVLDEEQEAATCGTRGKRGRPGNRTRIVSEQLDGGGGSDAQRTPNTYGGGLQLLLNPGGSFGAIRVDVGGASNQSLLFDPYFNGVKQFRVGAPDAEEAVFELGEDNFGGFDANFDEMEFVSLLGSGM